MINYTLRAESQTHFIDDSTNLKSHFQVFQEGESRWNILLTAVKFLADLNEDNLENRMIELTGELKSLAWMSLEIEQLCLLIF
ncbi:MAG: hypothetical protein CM1200mP40_14080 [Gammaproteobacteria bacterium]|nr:MAG: hypothetical protein CM1200mP40_14080 [Gammaproteobacteria bacterium]